MSLRRDWCRHYNGIGNSNTCDAGVEYESIKDTSVVPYRWHCINADSAIQCVKLEEYTPEEIAEQKRKAAEFLARLVGFWDGGDVCPQCGATVDDAQQVGRSVYVRPCGCRAGQGELPDKWKK